MARMLSIYSQQYWSEGRVNRLRREVTETSGLAKPTLLDLQLARQVALKGRAAVYLQRSQGCADQDLKAEIELAGLLNAETAGEASRSRWSRCPIVSPWPRRVSAGRLRHCSSSQALNSSQVAKRGSGTMKLRRAQPTIPSTLPLSLPFPGRP